MLRINEAIVPVIRINNRKNNQLFLETGLGMKTIVEEGPFAEFGDQTGPSTKLVLMESPSTRTRAVVGSKKLHKIVIKVPKASEIESLLALGAPASQLYQGKNGYGFEAISPEGDTFLLHAEESLDELTTILPPLSLQAEPGFSGLTSFEVESVWIQTPQPSLSQAFYDAILPRQSFLHFVEAAGVDLLTAAEEVWDLDSLRFPVEQDFDWAELESQLEGPFFKDRKARFIQTVDPSGIELWFEK